MDIQGLQAMRKEKDDFFRRHMQSPLTAAQKTKFSGLSYYPPNPDLVLEVKVDVLAQQTQIVMQTNRNELRPFYRYGTFTLTLGGESATLTVYQSPDGYYFLPFVDGNADVETYGAGRYLDIEPLEGDTFLIDFNLAYNPYCAYNDQWVCPITPKENRIALKINAGEKLPDSAWA